LSLYPIAPLKLSNSFSKSYKHSQASLFITKFELLSIADSLRIITQDIDIQNSIATLQSRYNSEKWQRESLQSSIEKKNILLISSFVSFIAIMVIIYIYYKYRTNQKLVKDINERIRKNDEGQTFSHAILLSDFDNPVMFLFASPDN